MVSAGRVDAVLVRDHLPELKPWQQYHKYSSGHSQVGGRDGGGGGGGGGVVSSVLLVG